MIYYCRCGIWLAEVDNDERVRRVNRKAMVQRRPRKGEVIRLVFHPDGRIVDKPPESRWSQGETWSLVEDGHLRVVCGECGLGTNFYPG